MIGGARSFAKDFCESPCGLRVVPKHPGSNRREDFVFHLNPLVANAPQEKRFVKTAFLTPTYSCPLPKRSDCFRLSPIIRVY